MCFQRTLDIQKITTNLETVHTGQYFYDMATSPCVTTRLYQKLAQDQYTDNIAASAQPTLDSLLLTLGSFLLSGRYIHKEPCNMNMTSKLLFIYVSIFSRQNFFFSQFQKNQILIIKNRAVFYFYFSFALLTEFLLVYWQRWQLTFVELETLRSCWVAQVFNIGLAIGSTKVLKLIKLPSCC